MPKFINAVRDWNTEAFARSLKREIAYLGKGVLPLDKGVTYGGAVDDSELTVTLLRSDDDGPVIVAHVGVFFTEVIGGCSCGDEPTPTPAYCELRIRIDKATAEAELALVSE
ncbi:MAG: glucosamine--fructose-6-phosphate aminotransferase [Gammaproteobacteria bacterium]|nr:glucosamine--fructose-6-phosphate aminotransferase [Gammaproteobacteria bacterium]